MNVRLKAYELFKAIVRDGGYSNLVLANGLSQDIYVTDRGFITALVYGAIDKIYNIDYIISLFAKGRLQPRVHDVLRLSVYQLMYMDVADYTVCDEAVKLISAVGKSALKGYVNGVLRNILRNRNNIQYPDKKSQPVKYISCYYSVPEFLAQEMLCKYSMEEAEEMLSYSIDTGTAIKANTIKCTNDALVQHLNQRKIDSKSGIIFDDIHYIKGNRLIKDELYKQGYFVIQSEPSVLICKALGAQKGERILDCCAAPGGKSIQIAQMIGEGSVVACDLHQHRCDLISSNAERCGVDNIVATRCLDATVYNSDLGLFDRVLIDAPCSGLGVVSTKPDIKLKITKEKIRDIEQTQEAIIENCSKYVKSGGVLLYSTCTVRAEENSIQALKFLKNHNDFYIESIDVPPSISDAVNKNGFVQLMPHKHGVYGFFIAKFRRK